MIILKFKILNFRFVLTCNWEIKGKKVKLTVEFSSHLLYDSQTTPVIINVPHNFQHKYPLNSYTLFFHHFLLNINTKALMNPKIKLSTMNHRSVQF